MQVKKSTLLFFFAPCCLLWFILTLALAISFPIAYTMKPISSHSPPPPLSASPPSQSPPPSHGDVLLSYSPLPPSSPPPHPPLSCCTHLNMTLNTDWTNSSFVNTTYSFEWHETPKGPAYILIKDKCLINETIMSQPTGCIEVIPVSNLSEWVIFSVENTSIPATGETDINNTECPATLEHPTSFNLVWSSIPAFHDHNSTNNIFECVDPPD